MAQPLVTLLSGLNDRISELKTVHQDLISRIHSLEEENKRLRSELAESKEHIRQAETDAEFLMMSHRLADSPDTIISTRRRIARLIRTVDKCISMLKEE